MSGDIKWAGVGGRIFLLDASHSFFELFALKKLTIPKMARLRKTKAPCFLS
jgi:hypothetical protein